MFDYLIVGAGFAGSVLAERLARGSNKKVLVVDRRSHIGGNAYDCFDDHGILIHKYGPHIFHTNSDDVFSYLGRYTQWRQYQHRVRACVDGRLVRWNCWLEVCAAASDMSCTLCMPPESASIWIWQAQSR